jgi:hypothetical protein
MLSTVWRCLAKISGTGHRPVNSLCSDPENIYKPQSACFTIRVSKGANRLLGLRGVGEFLMRYPIEKKPSYFAVIFLVIFALITPTVSYAATTKKLSEDFSSFACNPNDPRLKTLKFPTGASLEIKAAAACVALSYIENPKSRSKINIKLSPNFQKDFYTTLMRSVSAADRIFGRFGYKNSQTIEVFGSDNPTWLCEYGTKLYKERSSIEWAKMPDSGCGENTQGRSRADVIDKGKTPVLWFLTTPQRRLEPATGKYQTWPEQLQQFGHELAHGTMFQLSNFFNTRYVEHPGGWYPEGQAQYLDLAIAWLEFKDNSWRERLLSAGSRDAAKYFPRKPVSFESLSAQNEEYGQAIYSLGGIASEYLIAHYGLKKTFDWYSTWSAPDCEFPNTQTCWKERSINTFGQTPEQLFKKLDTYVNKQLQINYTTKPVVSQPVQATTCLGEKLPKNAIKTMPIGLDIAESARNCTIYSWLNKKGSEDNKISLISNVKPSSVIENRAIAEARIGLHFYKSLLVDQDTQIKIIMSTNPEWTCKYFTKELTGSNQEDVFRSLKGVGCPGATIVNGHSWDGWEKANCNELYTKVNLPFFAQVKGEMIAYVLLSRCASDIQGSKSYNLNITRKLAQSFFSQIGGFGFRRYLFESGWQEIIGQYGQSIYFENSANLYADSITKAGITSKADQDFLRKNLGKLTSIKEMPDAPSDYPNFNFWRVQSNIAAEYLIGTFGVSKSLEILVAWERAKSTFDRSEATRELTGISEDELFSRIDSYILERLK